MSESLPSIHNPKLLEKFFHKRQWSATHLRAFRRMFYLECKSLKNIDLPSEMLQEISESFSFGELKIATKIDSQLDGATKILFETVDGHKIETVILRIESGRASVCVSSQVGCTESCSFCSTGRMGFKRNLTAHEIIDQFYQAQLLLEEEGLSIRNIVFMGMGEPLRNLEGVFGAIDFFLDQKAYQLAHRHITVSTSGLPEEMIQFAMRFPKVSFALSLNGDNDDVRDILMPINQRFPLEKLRSTLEEMEAIRNSDVFVEYIVFKDMNDSLEAAARVYEFLESLKVRVNLIPYNNSDGKGEYETADDGRVQDLRRYLTDRGLRCTVRYSLGQDIAAACGQLANKSENSEQLAVNR